MIKKHKGLKIILLVDRECYFDNDPHYLGITSKSKKTCEYFISDSLRRNGHSVCILPFNNDIYKLIFDIQEVSPDIVFNYIQHIENDRSKELLIPALLDLLNIKYTGPDPYGCMLSIDKKICKDILNQNGVLVPNSIEITPDAKLNFAKIEYPVIVKPNFEGGSTNINSDNIVKNKLQLERILKKLFFLQHKSILIESFIVGKEITIALVGNNSNLKVYYPYEIKFPKSKIGWGILTQKIKYNKKYRMKQELYSCKLKNKYQVQKIMEIVIKTFEILKMRDYARIDLRIKESGEIYVIDANSNPGLKPAKGTLIDLFDGKSFDSIIQSIIDVAMARN